MYELVVGAGRVEWGLCGRGIVVQVDGFTNVESVRIKERARGSGMKETGEFTHWYVKTKVKGC
jgi:hypothetical protein